MKHKLFIIIILALSFTLVGCSEKNTETGKINNSSIEFNSEAEEDKDMFTEKMESLGLTVETINEADEFRSEYKEALNQRGTIYGMCATYNQEGIIENEFAVYKEMIQEMFEGEIEATVTEDGDVYTSKTERVFVGVKKDNNKIILISSSENIGDCEAVFNAL